MNKMSKMIKTSFSLQPAKYVNNKKLVNDINYYILIH